MPLVDNIVDAEWTTVPLGLRVGGFPTSTVVRGKLHVFTHNYTAAGDLAAPVIVVRWLKRPNCCCCSYS